MFRNTLVALRRDPHILIASLPKSCTMDRPNVLLVVWDACRVDAAGQHAPNLQSLAEDNLRFENAITAAGQSLGSHVSMFTGEYPHEHGIYKQTDMIETPLPLLAELGDRGYRRYGVSANGFASSKYGFDRGFDVFYNTQGVTVFPEGLDVHRYAREVREKNGGEFAVDSIDYGDLLRQVFGHDRPIRSAANVGTAALSELVGKYPALRHVPHPRFDTYNEFTYDPDQNTALVTRLLNDATEEEPPFFLFSNYMDAHHPYAPLNKYQRQLCGQTFSYRELSRFAELSHPFGFLERVHSEDADGVSEADLRTVRQLYAGEVRTADEHLGRILKALEVKGLREKTVVVVTADHGENLGEINRMGEQHMGHIRSASDPHLRVPLVVAHPDLNGRTVDRPVSLKNIYRLFTDGLNQLIASEGRAVDPLVPDDDVARSEVLRTTATELNERYPSLTDLLQRHLCAAYSEDWTVVASSRGTRWAWRGDTETSVDEAPDQVTAAATESMEALVADDGSERELTDSERNRLEALGYL